MKASVWSVKGKRCGPEPSSVLTWIGIRLVATVLVSIASDRVLGISGVIAIVIDLAETHMAVHEPHHALGIAIERHVVLAGLALVPRKRSVCRPFHYQQRLLGPIHRSKLPPPVVWAVFYTLLQAPEPNS